MESAYDEYKLQREAAKKAVLETKQAAWEDFSRRMEKQSKIVLQSVKKFKKVTRMWEETNKS